VAVGPMKPPSVVTFKRRLAAAADGEAELEADAEADVDGEADAEGEDTDPDADGEDADPDEEAAGEGALDEGGDPVGADATEQPPTMTASATARRIWIGKRTVIVSPGRVRHSASKA
jgi:hypothetical protein